MTEIDDNNNLTEDLEKCRKQAEEYLNNWKRERADFLNYKKDETKRVGDFLKFANEGIILEIVEALDDLELAVKKISDSGLDQVLKKFYDLLAAHGVERIKIKGEKFNPEYHEALANESSGEGLTNDENAKMEEIRAGYIMDGKVIRPARVLLNKDNL